MGDNGWKGRGMGGWDKSIVIEAVAFVEFGRKAKKSVFKESCFDDDLRATPHRVKDRR